MKSDKPQPEKASLKKTVKAVTKSIRERSAAVAAKLKPSKATGKPEAQTPPPAEEPPIVARHVPKSAGAKPKKKAAAKPSTPKRVPAILLEGDRPAAPLSSGPGERYALGPTAPAEHLGAAEAELPEAYGTKRLFLAARDPHWLYARWDLTSEQQRHYNRLSTDRHLVLRLFLNEAAGEPLSQVHVHPESTHWFCHVPHAGSKYVAELGYYPADGGKWVTVSASGATLTPPDAMSEDFTAEFATIPVEVPFAKIMELARTSVRENVPLSEVLQELRANGYTIPESRPPSKWTPERESALAGIITMDQVRRVWMGSVEITELIRRQLQQEISSMGAAQFGQPSSPFGAVTSVSSPFGGGEERKKGFWFNVNAELIIYGATEPDAQVTIGGRVIKLRPDGSFSYRFALPDGEYELPAVAVSSDKTDARAAGLRFGRSTEYRGDVGAHPQDPQLKTPEPANVA